MNLRYDRNYLPKGEHECVCPSCGVVCRSTSAFDAHRVPLDGYSKICLESLTSDPRFEVDVKGRLAIRGKTPRKPRTGEHLAR